MFNKLVDERHDKKLQLSKISNYDDLIYHLKSKNIAKNLLMNLKKQLKFFEKIKYGTITLKNVTLSKNQI